MSEESKSAESRDRQPDASQAGKPGGEQTAATGAGEATGEREDSNAAAGEPAGKRDDNDAAGVAPGDEPRTPDKSQDSGADEAVETEKESLAAQLEAARAELTEHKDRYMRAAAEAENVRRRAENDIASARKFAIEGFASEVLSVRDSLEIARSLEIDEDDAGAVAKMKEGLDLTLKQLDGTLSKFSIEAVNPEKGDKLDPEKHQAMSTQESDNVPPNHVLSVIQKGYTIHGRLLRPAMVVVAKKPEEAAGSEGETA